MAFAKENIYISWFTGRTFCITFPSSKLNNVRISELRSRIHDKMGIEVEDKRLIYGTKDLENESSGRIMTFRDYGIRGGTTIVIVTRIPGGGDPGFIPLKFADVTSEDKFIPIEFASSAPKWREVSPGLSFTGICKKSGCAAINDIVLVNKGFYESTGGQCALSFEIFNLECPMCHKELNKKEVRGVGIYECKVTVKYLQEGHVDKFSYDIVSKDKYQYAGCMDEKDQINYVYVILIVKKL